MSPSAPHISECSARHHMKSIKTIDFSVVAEDAALGVAPVSWSAHNCLVFGRNNRVYWKNMGSIVHSNVDDSESAFQFAKIRDSYGRLTHVDCAGKDQQNTVALGTSKGCVQIWDIATKKMTMSFSTSGVSAMKWNGPVLTIGGPKGAIRHFDTRISPSSKMKEQTKKVTRHQAKICNVAYNMDGIMLASGDETGLIHCWDLRQKGIPMNVGDVVQRRKKMQHIGPITALNWSPWSPKLLASGDSAPDKTGTIRTWNIVASLADTNSNLTHTLPVDCTITSLNFSPHCKEILATHGHGRVIMPPAHHELDESPPLEPVHSKIENCAVVWNYPTLMEVSKVRLGDKAPTGGLISPNGQRAVLAIPEEGHLRVYDVWSKPKESLRRNRSSMDLGGLIR
ncbi:WD40 repeat-like protein [Abortiporus biennis]|nr:WD40 repeat-like protein [Abortiporus biennis]